VAQHHAATPTLLFVVFSFAFLRPLSRRHNAARARVTGRGLDRLLAVALEKPLAVAAAVVWGALRR
jgi:hypothetical protein